MGVSQTSKSIHEISVSSSLDSHTQEPGDRTLSLTLRRVTQTGRRVTSTSDETCSRVDSSLRPRAVERTRRCTSAGG